MAIDMLTTQLTGVHVPKDDLSHQQSELATCTYAPLLRWLAANP